MSHEEPDVEVPKAELVKGELQSLGATHEPPPGELRGRITWQVLAAGLLVAVLMGASYPYMVMKLGFGPNVSVVAAFFGFLLLKLFDILLRQRSYDRWQNNLAEAAGTSAAQTAFMCVLLGAFDMLRNATGGRFAQELDFWDSFLWLTTACTLGVLLAVPLRRHFIVDEKLPYVDGLSTGETITVMDPPRTASEEVKKNAMAALRAVTWGVALSAFVMVHREDAKFSDWFPEGWYPHWRLIGGEAYDAVTATFAPMMKHLVSNFEPLVAGALGTGVVLGNLAVGASVSLLSIGSGMLVGLRINVSMVLGAGLAWILMPYILVDQGVELARVKEVVNGQEVSRAVFTDHPSRTQILFWVMWPATGMLVLGGLTALALRWRILVQTFKSLRSASIDSSEFPLSIVVPGIAISGVALVVVQWQLLGMPPWMTLVAILMSLPLMLVGLRVLGETNWGPISALSNMMQGLFAAVAPGNVTANMVASGTTGTIATSSEAIMQDYKAGDMVGTKPRLLTMMQLMAVPIGAAAVSIMYEALVDNFGLAGDGNKAIPDSTKLSSPISAKWAGFAQILEDGVSALPASALYALVVFSILGVVLTVLESNKKIKKWVPSPTGIGIGILVPFSVVFTMFIGGVIGAIWERKNKKSSDLYMVPLGSGFIAGEALVAVFAAVYFAITGKG